MHEWISNQASKSGDPMSVGHGPEEKATATDAYALTALASAFTGSLTKTHLDRFQRGWL